MTMNDGEGICAAEVDTGLRGRVWAVLRQLAATLREAKAPNLAAQVAYSLIFAMPSIVLLVALIAGQIDRHTGFAITQEVRRAILQTLPPDVHPVMTGLLDDATARASAAPTTVSAIISI